MHCTANYSRVTIGEANQQQYSRTCEPLYFISKVIVGKVEFMIWTWLSLFIFFDNNHNC